MPEYFGRKEHEEQIRHIFRLLFGAQEKKGDIDFIKELGEVASGKSVRFTKLSEMHGLPFDFFCSQEEVAFSGTIAGVEKYVDYGEPEDGICLNIYISVPYANGRKVRCITWNWHIEGWAVWYDDASAALEKDRGVFRIYKRQNGEAE